MATRNGARIDYRRWRQSQRENQYPHFAGALVISDAEISLAPALRTPFSKLYLRARPRTPREHVVPSRKIIVSQWDCDVIALVRVHHFFEPSSTCRPLDTCSLTGAFLAEAGTYLPSMRQVAAIEG